ncbi:hypothetical protein BDZ88DRAFT_126679 [Geranomyces variabilis]|nr:hypothetical protein BDZ88DRAFT_126679 [Geranomyces variabilis]KAJ3135268.1 hypothetical protein HDU90_003991 [Geranomyces variabilis]
MSLPEEALPESVVLPDEPSNEPSVSAPAVGADERAPNGEAPVTTEARALTPGVDPSAGITASQATPVAASIEISPQDPLISATALDSGVHANTEPELDVRFIAPTGTSNAVLEPPAVSQKPAPAEGDQSQQLAGPDADPREIGHTTGAQSEEPPDQQQATPEAEKEADSAESKAGPDEPVGELLPILLKPGWKMELDVSAILNKKNTTDPYITACKQLHIVPVTFILQRLQSTAIIMPHHGLGPSGAEALARVLGNNNTLKELDLTNNAIEAGGAALGRALQINRTLSVLNLTGNRLNFEGSADIADMLQFNNSLQTLILKDNALGDKEAQLFAENLRQNSSLQVLDLSYNLIGDLGAIALGAGVGGNDGLRDLNLAWNRIRHKGVAGFLAGLKDNAVLTTLNLEASGIGDTGSSVASFLGRNSSIQVLNLRRTRLNDASLIPISKAVEQNYSLRELDLSDNPWSNTGALPLFKSLLNSTSGVTKLLMRNVKLTKDIRPKIDELLAEKTDLQIIEISEADEMIAEKEKRTGMGSASRGSKDEEGNIEISMREE